jgi:hypothetical protein
LLTLSLVVTLGLFGGCGSDDGGGAPGPTTTSTTVGSTVPRPGDTTQGTNQIG